MRRAILIVLGTAAGTSLLVGAKHSAGEAARLAAAAQAQPADPSAAPASPAPGGAAPAGSAPPAAGQPAAANPPTAAKGPLTVAGPVVETDYGTVQVQITWVNGKMTDIVTLKLPAIESRSEQIAQRAVPILRKSALAAQSAKVASVSGATYTSEGYKKSLQGAIDNAKAGRTG